MDDVRLGRVERHLGVANVLSGVKEPLRQRTVELAQRHQAGGRQVPKPGDRLQALAHQVEAGHAVHGKIERLLGLDELADRKALVLGRELAADRAPHVLLGLGVLNGGRRFTKLPCEGERGDLTAPPPVLRVAGARVVGGEVNGDLAVGSGGHGRVELPFLEHVRESSTWRAASQVCTGSVSNLPSSTGPVG
jgi:hypothetical protein